MASLAAAKAENEKLRLENTVAVVVGGTNGIGAALAVKIARHSKNPSIHIVGRNTVAAQNVISQMRAVNPDGKYEFHKRDASLLSQVHAFIRELKITLPRITHLVLTQGMLTNAGRTETPEGNDIKVTLHYYSRFLFMRDLQPSLLAAGNAKVMTVLHASRGDKKKLKWDDLDLKEEGSYSMNASADHCVTMTDIAIQDLAARNPTISYTHAYPGIVATNVFDGIVPGFLNTPSKWLLNAFGTSSSDCAEWLFHAMQNSQAGSPHYVGSHGEPVKGKVMANNEEMEKIWKHTNAIVDANA